MDLSASYLCAYYINRLAIAGRVDIRRQHGFSSEALVFSIRECRILGMARKNSQIALKPQDVLVLFKLASATEFGFTYASFAESIGISASALHGAIERLLLSQLVTEQDGEMNLVTSAFVDFVIFGAVYFLPAVQGPMTRGFPTAYGVPPLSHLLVESGEMNPVWPSAIGPERGFALYPIYPSVPDAIESDEGLYQLLALFDGMRIGAARDRELARELFRERM